MAPVATLVGVISGVVGILTFIKAVIEYARQNKLKRYEKFQEMSRRFDENHDIAMVCELVMQDAPQLADIAKYKKEVVICFFEEVAILQNSRILPENLIVNSFGYYAIKCYESKHFWANLDKCELFYGLLTGFCEKMLAAREKITLEEIRSIRI